MLREMIFVERVVKLTGRKFGLEGRLGTGEGENFFRIPVAKPPLFLESCRKNHLYCDGNFS